MFWFQRWPQLSHMYAYCTPRREPPRFRLFPVQYGHATLPSWMLATSLGAAPDTHPTGRGGRAEAEKAPI
eukprot:6328052-Prymnesium_polylepis.2